MQSVEHLHQEVELWKSKYLQLLAQRQKDEAGRWIRQEGEKKKQREQDPPEIVSEKKTCQVMLESALVDHRRNRQSRYILYNNTYKFIPVDGAGIGYVCENCSCELRRQSRTKSYLQLGRHYCHNQ